MKTIKGLKNMKSISRGALIEALQGKPVALVGVIHVPEGEDNAQYTLRILDKQLEELEEKYCISIGARIFKGTSQGYKRGTSNHFWQKGDYCLNWLTYYIIVTNLIIMVLKVC